MFFECVHVLTGRTEAALRAASATAASPTAGDGTTTGSLLRGFFSLI